MTESLTHNEYKRPRKRSSAPSDTAIVMRCIHAAENAWPTGHRGPRETSRSLVPRNTRWTGSAGQETIGCKDGSPGGYRRLRNVTVPDDSAVETVNSQQPGSGKSMIEG